MSTSGKLFAVSKRYFPEVEDMRTSTLFYLTPNQVTFRCAPATIHHAMNRAQWYADNLLWFVNKAEAEFVRQDLELSNLDVEESELNVSEWYLDMTRYFRGTKNEWILDHINRD